MIIFQAAYLSGGKVNGEHILTARIAASAAIWYTGPDCGASKAGSPSRDPSAFKRQRTVTTMVSMPPPPPGSFQHCLSWALICPRSRSCSRTDSTGASPSRAPAVGPVIICIVRRRRRRVRRALARRILVEQRGQPVGCGLLLFLLVFLALLLGELLLLLELLLALFRLLLFLGLLFLFFCFLLLFLGLFLVFLSLLLGFGSLQRLVGLLLLLELLGLVGLLLLFSLLQFVGRGTGAGSGGNAASFSAISSLGLGASAGGGVTGSGTGLASSVGGTGASTGLGFSASNLETSGLGSSLALASSSFAVSLPFLSAQKFRRRDERDRDRLRLGGLSSGVDAMAK